VEALVTVVFIDARTRRLTFVARFLASTEASRSSVQPADQSRTV
jgi:hypothetical protein